MHRGGVGGVLLRISYGVCRSVLDIVTLFWYQNYDNIVRVSDLKLYLINKLITAMGGLQLT